MDFDFGGQWLVQPADCTRTGHEPGDCRKVYQDLVCEHAFAGTRVLHGLLALAGKHPLPALEAAAEKALHRGTWRLRDLRLLLERAGPSPQLDFLETHPFPFPWAVRRRKNTPRSSSGI